MTETIDMTTGYTGEKYDMLYLPESKMALI